jgi:zinc/manganese transport system substrate-binding protein
MKSRIFLLITSLAFLVPGTGSAHLDVVATLSDLGWIAGRVGGEDVDVSILCPGHQDPHYLPPKPSLARSLRQADLLVYNGLELELGWLPVLIDAARNPDVRPGRRGELECALAIEEVLQKPVGPVDRSQGDVHPLGNPHFLLDPRNGIAVAHLMADRMAELDPDCASHYRLRAEEFAAEMEALVPVWQESVTDAVTCPVIVYHQHWEYLFNWLGIESIGAIEHRPGISPSPKHVEELIQRGRDEDCVTVIAATWDNLGIAEKAAERLDAPLCILPGALGATDAADSYPGLFTEICRRLREAAARGETS